MSDSFLISVRSRCRSRSASSSLYQHYAHRILRTKPLPQRTVIVPPTLIHLFVVQIIVRSRALTAIRVRAAVIDGYLTSECDGAFSVLECLKALHEAIAGPVDDAIDALDVFGDTIDFESAKQKLLAQKSLSVCRPTGKTPAQILMQNSDFDDVGIQGVNGIVSCFLFLRKIGGTQVVDDAVKRRVSLLDSTYSVLLQHPSFLDLATKQARGNQTGPRGPVTRLALK